VNRKPSPALVISIIALVMATTGSAVAAVNFARNADHVDGKSAVSARATSRQAAGKLVATHRGGSDRGKIDAKFLGGVVTGAARSFARTTEVVDNSTTVPTDLAVVPGVGKLSVSCRDESNKAGTENPSTTITFSNLSGTVLSYARTVGGDDAAVGVLQPAAVSQFRIDGANTFAYRLTRGAKYILIDGVVRQDGLNSGAASCVVYGVALGLP
jgi:hypothetical protein